jgi:hypothetical protein
MRDELARIAYAFLYVLQTVGRQYDARIDILGDMASNRFYACGKYSHRDKVAQFVECVCRRYIQSSTS